MLSKCSHICAGLTGFGQYGIIICCKSMWQFMSQEWKVLEMFLLFDDENDILQMAREHMQCDSVLQFNGNSFNKKIFRCLLDEANLIADNGHDVLPPDFYSDEHSMMFDVLRINDSEVKKTYNPVKIRERKGCAEVSQEFDGIFAPDAKMLVISDSDDAGECAYKKYVKNTRRVIGEHIKKLPLWKERHPDIKYKGLFVFDETEVYFEGLSMPSGCSEFGKRWVRGVKCGCELHRPWLDERLIGQVYESGIDFVVWFCPYKPCGVALDVEPDFPYMTIVDTRFHFDKYVAYPDDLVC